MLSERLRLMMARDPSELAILGKTSKSCFCNFAILLRILELVMPKPYLDVHLGLLLVFHF